MEKLLERPLSALDAIYTRRSVRSYTSQRVESSTIRALLDAAVQAPTAMLEQPWAFIVVQDPDVLRQLSDRAKAMWVGEAAPSPELHIEDELGIHRSFAERLADPAFDIFYHATTLIVICARRTDPFVVADCWLAAENLMLAANALGLGTCCIGAAVPALNAPDGKEDLGMPADFTAVVPIVVGVPSGTVSPVSRREPAILSWK
jgi:nitroreductase